VWLEGLRASISAVAPTPGRKNPIVSQASTRRRPRGIHLTPVRQDDNTLCSIRAGRLCHCRACSNDEFCSLCCLNDATRGQADESSSSNKLHQNTTPSPPPSFWPILIGRSSLISQPSHTDDPGRTQFSAAAAARVCSSRVHRSICNWRMLLARVSKTPSHLQSIRSPAIHTTYPSPIQQTPCSFILEGFLQ
jgi:hypothetical protein